MTYFGRDRTENLHPDLYNCLRCNRKEKDLYASPEQCPRCELTIKREFYKDEIRREIRERVGRFPKDYSLQDLIDLYYQVSSLLARNRDLIPRFWPVRTARLARVLLDERNQAKRVDDWEFREKMRRK